MAFKGSLFKHLLRKRIAFRKVFDDKDDAARVVLAELKRICPADPSVGTGNPIDERKVFINIVRRQVLNHILAIIHMPDEKLNQIAREEEYHG